MHYLVGSYLLVSDWSISNLIAWNTMQLVLHMDFSKPSILVTANFIDALYGLAVWWLKNPDVTGRLIRYTDVAIAWCSTQQVPKSLLNIWTGNPLNCACHFIKCYFRLALWKKQNISFRSFWASSLKSDVLKPSLIASSNLWAGQRIKK